jgi:hypothetical protein
VPPSDYTVTPAGFRRNAWLASIGTGGWFRSESMAGIAGIRNKCRSAQRISSRFRRNRCSPASPIEMVSTATMAGPSRRGSYFIPDYV